MTNNEAHAHRSFSAYLIETGLPLLLPAVAFLAAVVAFVLGGAPAQACEPQAQTVAASSSTVTYEFATDETAAGDLDVEWNDNYDYEADSPYCTIKPVNVSAYGPDVMLVHCAIPGAVAERDGIV